MEDKDKIQGGKINTDNLRFVENDSIVEEYIYSEEQMKKLFLNKTFKKMAINEIKVNLPKIPKIDIDIDKSMENYRQEWDTQKD